MSIKCSEGKPVHTPPQNYGLKMGIPQSFNKGFAGHVNSGKGESFIYFSL